MPPAVEENEDFPWHDLAMPLDERMQLAQGRSTENLVRPAQIQMATTTKTQKAFISKNGRLLRCLLKIMIAII